MATQQTSEDQETYREFRQLVNMAPRELEKWLDTEESQSVGQTSGDGEAIGHKSGKRIVEIKRTKKAELTPDDYDHMQRVVGYIKRHKAQGPTKSQVKNSDWRYSLMNWGHDPMKDS